MNDREKFDCHSRLIFYKGDLFSSDELSKANRSDMVLAPEVVALKEELKHLESVLSQLLYEHDELIYVACKNLRMAYQLNFGPLECKVFDLYCQVLRLKRKMTYIQRKKNRQEKINLLEIEHILDEVFLEYQARLHQLHQEVQAALEHYNLDVLSDEEAKELKKLYRIIIKSLHPDLHPDLTSRELTLFQNAVLAYERGDLDNLKIIHAVVTDIGAEADLVDDGQDSIAILQKEKERLLTLIDTLRDKIEGIKGEYPYMMKALLEDDEKIATKQDELRKRIASLEADVKYYQKKIEKMLEEES